MLRPHAPVLVRCCHTGGASAAGGRPRAAGIAAAAVAAAATVWRCRATWASARSVVAACAATSGKRVAFTPSDRVAPMRARSLGPLWFVDGSTMTAPSPSTTLEVSSATGDCGGCSLQTHELIRETGPLFGIVRAHQLPAA